MADGKWISDLTETTPIADAARRVLAVRLEVVREYLRLAVREADKDIEYVHQLRVGTRRAGAALEIFSLCLPEKVYKTARRQLRGIRRAAGAARDWDVFMANLIARKHKRGDQPGLDFLYGYAAAQRAVAQVQLEQASPNYPFDFERFLAETVAAVRNPQTASNVEILIDLARPKLSRLLHELSQAVHGNLENYAHLHQVRIIGKRLRYAMEVFADCFAAEFRAESYPAVEEMQDILGRANDSHVAGQRLEAMLARLRASQSPNWQRYKQGIENLLAYHQQRLPQEREHFREWWHEWEKSGTEAQLFTLLKATNVREWSQRIEPVFPGAAGGNGVGAGIGGPGMVATGGAVPASGGIAANGSGVGINGGGADGPTAGEPMPG